MADDGGPAFPELDSLLEYYGDNDHRHYEAVTIGGMTMRDWFAGQAMAGARMNPDGFLYPTHFSDISEWAYELADAMLAERRKE